MVPVTPRHTAGRDHPGPAIEPAWLARLLAAHGPQGRVLAGQYPAAARACHGGADTRPAGVRVAAGKFWRVSHGWSCPGNIGCVTWRQRGARRGAGRRNMMLTKREAGEAVRAAKARLGVTWAQLAEAVGR